MTDPRILSAILRNDLSAFSEKVFHTLHPGKSLKPNWHLDAMAHRLDQVRNGENLRLAISVPPRSAKSIYASVALPAFIMGHDPGKKIAVVSYSSDLAAKFSRDFRTVVTSSWYKALFPAMRLSAQKNTEDEIETTERGVRFAWSVGGAMTGLGVDLIIVDDPIKAEDAFSQVIRDRVNHIFDASLLSRLDDPQIGAIIVVMQRFNEDDLIGHVLAKSGWTHLCLPAIAEKDEEIPIGPNKTHKRRAGEALHPDRAPLAALERTRAEAGTFVWSSQYQQNPLPTEGNIIKWKWFRTYDVAPGRDEGDIVQSWDTAAKVGASNAYSACLTFLRKGEHHYLLDVLRVKAEYPELRKIVIDHANLWRPHDLVIEQASSGTALIQEFRARSDLPQPIAIQPIKAKDERMSQEATIIETGAVFIPTSAPRLDDFKKEVLQFPHGSMDLIDALSQYLYFVRTHSGFEATWM